MRKAVRFRTRLHAELTKPRNLRTIFIAAPAPVESGPVSTVRRLFAGGKGGEGAAEGLERLVERSFDCPDIARRCLGTQWGPRSPKERDEMTRLMRGLIARAHWGRLAGAGHAIFTGERVQGETAWVRCWLTRGDGQRLPAEYQLHRVSGRWLVADFTIEGTAFVKGHGGYLRGVVEGGTFDDLLWKLRLKAAESAPAAPNI
jgi:hypothetical protein